MADIATVTAQYQRLKMLHSDRDRAMREVLLVRQGKLATVFPDMFPEDGPIPDRSMVANMVDIAARDTAEVIAPLPAFNCSSATSVADKARRFAEKRTRIANNYVSHSRSQQQMYDAADGYVTYGFAIAVVEIDWEHKLPYIKFLDPMGCYTVRDRFERVTAFYQTMWHDIDTLCAYYPHLESQINGRRPGQRDRIEVVRYHDKDSDLLFLPANGNGMELQRIPNPVGEVLVVETRRPGLGGSTRGQFDDVLAVQVAKARFALLALEAATKSVQAPLALPNDIVDMAIGGDEAIRSSTPEKIRRVPLDIPQAAFAEQATLDQELRSGSRYPDARNGQVSGSIVTGKGVQALMSGFDTQVRTAQAMFAESWTRLIELCFKVDEALWPNTSKTIRGNENGTPYEIKYTPSRDIAQDYSVDVQYGLMAGLDPNAALVFGLQARGDKLISRDFLRRQMPFSLNAGEEEQKVDIEELREALKQAVAGYAQAIPILAQNGQDPGEILARLGEIIAGRQKGTEIEKIVSEAFAPQAPPPGADQMGGPPSPDQADGGGVNGLDAMGRVRGVAPGQAGMAPGGRPDMQTLLAGLTQQGGPSLQAGISRRLPI